MLRLTLVIAIALHSIAIAAQKRVVSSDSFNQWPELGGLSISPDGKYAAYIIRNKVDNVDSLIIQSTDNTWRVYAINANNCFYSDDSKRIFYTSGGNGVVVQSLGRANKETIKDIDIVIGQLDESKGQYSVPIKDWLLGYKASDPKTLVAYNIHTRKVHTYKNVKSVHYTDKGNILLLECSENQNGMDMASVKKLDISNNEISNIWQGSAVSSFVMNDLKNKAAFIGEDAEAKRVFLYDFKTASLKSVFMEETSADNSGLSLKGIQFFNGESGLFLQLSKKPMLKFNNDTVKLNIWSYTDKKLQPVQLSEREKPDEYTVYADFKSGRYFQVSHGNERLTLLNDKYVLVSVDNDTISLPSIEIPNNYYYIQPLDHSKRIQVPRTLHGEVRVSPDGRFLVYYNMEEKCYYSYEVSTNICRNITKSVFTEWSGNYEGMPRGIAGWRSEDNAIYIYDRFDIWKLDLFGGKIAVNITNGFGEKNHIIFARVISNEYRSDISNEREIPVLAFNKKTKDNGFFWTSMLKQQNPRLASMGPYIYDISKFSRGINSVGPGNNMLPIKADKSNKYIVQRSGAGGHFNYYSTSDFKNFRQLSFLQPQKEFNWYTSELHTWKSLNGDSTQGILYKPENFDSSKKYPLIYLIYDDESDGLNSYWRPGWAWNGNINIPYLVSRGYLVFSPDFMIKLGEIGKNLIDATISSFDHLKKFSFIDTNRIGINGFSFGGYNAYFLITNTNIFAAAATGGGVTDLISRFGTIKDGRVMQFLGQTQLVGNTLWNSKKLIEYSPVFKIDKLQTPVLMLHNKEDGAVNFPQAIEFYTAARGLGKRAWLLEYENQGHGVDGPAAPDFTLRLMQFFDHYLKGKPAPLWMLEGRPARLRGIDDRLQLDTLGRTPQ